MTPGNEETSTPEPQPRYVAGSARPLCNGRRKADGELCGSPATDARGLWCSWHDPSKTDAEKREWASRGGQSTKLKALVRQMNQLSTEDRSELDRIIDKPDLSTDAKVAAFVERTIAEVRAGLLPSSTATALKGLLDVKLRLIGLQIEAQRVEEMKRIREGRGVIIVREDDITERAAVAGAQERAAATQGAQERAQERDSSRRGQGASPSEKKAPGALPAPQKADMWTRCERCGERSVHRSGPAGVEIATCIKCGFSS
jgi:hypothetical protein